MDISSSPGVSSALAATQSSSAGTARAIVLGVALNSQSQNIAALIQSIPQAAPLATSGALGTKVNTYA